MRLTGRRRFQPLLLAGLLSLSETRLNQVLPQIPSSLARFFTPTPGMALQEYGQYLSRLPEACRPKKQYHPRSANKHYKQTGFPT